MDNQNPTMQFGISMVFVVYAKKEDLEYKEWDNTHLTGAANCNRVIIIVYEF